MARAEINVQKFSFIILSAELNWKQDSQFYFWLVSVCLQAHLVN